MELTIKTTKLQEMLSKAVKGASNNKLIPLTSLIAISLDNGELTLTTTDATNYLYVKELVEGDDFYAVVNVDTFAKLIARMTCESVTLSLTDSYMNVIGNGSYKIDIPLDEDGSLISYPDPAKLVSRANCIGTIKTPVIKSILGSLKQSLMTNAVGSNFPWYASYYAGDQVIATDTFKISALNEQLFTEPKLISAEQMNLLDVVTSDEIVVYSDCEKMLYVSPHCELYAIEPSDIEEFSVDAITALISQPFASMCKLSKTALIRLLDRISLFVGEYDNGEVEFTFTSDSLEVSSKMSTGSEGIPYIECQNFKPFVCSVNVTMIASQIKAQSCDVIELWFGDENSIKMVTEDTTCVVALLTD